MPRESRRPPRGHGTLVSPTARDLKGRRSWAGSCAGSRRAHRRGACEPGLLVCIASRGSSVVTLILTTRHRPGQPCEPTIAPDSPGDVTVTTYISMIYKNNAGKSPESYPPQPPGRGLARRPIPEPLVLQRVTGRSREYAPGCPDVAPRVNDLHRPYLVHDLEHGFLRQLLSSRRGLPQKHYKFLQA